MLRADEQTRLLGGRRETEREPDIIHGPAECHPSPLSFTWTDFKALRLSPLSILPLSLFASHGIAVTIATTIYGYAYILCRDPAHCQESEQSAYAGTVAIATLIASLCGLLALGVLEHISRQNRKIGLMLWFTCRAMSIVMLAIGVHFKSITLALSGRVFQGLASDNLLHFNLNSIYVQAPDQESISYLVGSSLALYMTGVSIGPLVGSLFDDFTTSFTIAIALFSVALTYLIILRQGESPILFFNRTTDPIPSNSYVSSSTLRSFYVLVSMTMSPLRLFYQYPTSIPSGLSLLIFNAVQSYIFVALMIHTSLVFGFTSRQNGYLITIVHLIAALYLLFILFIVPLISRACLQKRPRSQLQPKSPSSVECSPTNGISIPSREPSAVGISRNSPSNAILALTCLTIQCISVLLLAFMSSPWQAYCIVCLLALSLATPSFIKSHIVGFIPPAERPRLIAALTLAETVGGLLAPVTLGATQSHMPGRAVFLIGAGMAAVSTSLFGVEALMKVRRE